MQVRRCRVTASSHAVHQPPHTDANGTAEPVEGDFLQEQAFHQAASTFINHAVLGVQDELSATVLAAMILFAVVNMAVFLVLRGCTRWTCLSDGHGCLLASLIAVSGLANHTIRS
jgi:hypothetical protein